MYQNGETERSKVLGTCLSVSVLIRTQQRPVSWRCRQTVLLLLAIPPGAAPVAESRSSQETILLCPQGYVDIGLALSPV